MQAFKDGVMKSLELSAQKAGVSLGSSQVKGKVPVKQVEVVAKP